MIFMPIIMLAPVLALPLFDYLTLENALPIYILILIVSIYCNGLMVWSMRAKAKGGVQAMIGKRALVVKDIDPLGQITLWGEVWTAAVFNEPIPAGKEVRILDAKGLVLTVDAVGEDDRLGSEHAQPDDDSKNVLHTV